VSFNLLRRAAILIMTAALETMLLAAPAYGAAPQGNGGGPAFTVFGLEGCSFFCASTVDSLDPNTGTSSIVANVGRFCPGAALASDPKSGTIFAAMEFGGGRCGFPADRIEVVQGISTTSHPVATAPRSMVFDPTTGDLLGDAGNSIVKISTADWSEQSVSLSVRPDMVAFSPATQTLYFTTLDFSASPVAGQLYAVDSRTLIVTVGPQMTEPVNALVYDPTGNRLLGVGNDYPWPVLRIDPVTGTETTIATPSYALGPPRSGVIEPARHEAVFLESESVFGGTDSVLDFVNDQNGATSQSAVFTTPMQSITALWSTSDSG
jgi:hypothetical protein